MARVPDFSGFCVSLLRPSSDIRIIFRKIRGRKYHQVQSKTNILRPILPIFQQETNNSSYQHLVKDNRHIFPPPSSRAAAVLGRPKSSGQNVVSGRGRRLSFCYLLGPRQRSRIRPAKARSIPRNRSIGRIPTTIWSLSAHYASARASLSRVYVCVCVCADEPRTPNTPSPATFGMHVRVRKTRVAEEGRRHAEPPPPPYRMGHGRALRPPSSQRLTQGRPGDRHECFRLVAAKISTASAPSRWWAWVFRDDETRAVTGSSEDRIALAFLFFVFLKPRRIFCFRSYMLSS